MVAAQGEPSWNVSLDPRDLERGPQIIGVRRWEDDSTNSTVATVVVTKQCATGGRLQTPPMDTWWSLCAAQWSSGRH